MYGSTCQSHQLYDQKGRPQKLAVSHGRYLGLRIGKGSNCMSCDNLHVTYLSKGSNMSMAEVVYSREKKQSCKTDTANGWLAVTVGGLWLYYSFCDVHICE